MVLGGGTGCSFFALNPERAAEGGGERGGEAACFSSLTPTYLPPYTPPHPSFPRLLLENRIYCSKVFRKLHIEVGSTLGIYTWVTHCKHLSGQGALHASVVIRY